MYNLQLKSDGWFLMLPLKLFNVWDSFEEDGIASHIFTPKKGEFSIPYPVMLGFSSITIKNLQKQLILAEK